MTVELAETNSGAFTRTSIVDRLLNVDEIRTWTGGRGRRRRGGIVRWLMLMKRKRRLVSVYFGKVII